MQLGNIHSTLSMESASFISGLNKAAQATTRATNSINSALSVARASVGGFVAAFGVQQVAQMAKGALDYADAIADLSDRTGASTKVIQEFRYAAQMSGSSVESADAALEKFTKTLGQAQSGSKAQVEMLRQLGVTNTDFDTALRQTVEGISKLETVQQKNAVAMKLFGKSAGDLTVLLGGGVGRFDELSRAAETLGVDLADDVVRGAGEANDKLDAMAMVVTAQFANVIVSNADAFVALASGVGSLASNLVSFWAQNPERAMAIVGALAGGVAGLMVAGPWGALAGATAGGIGGYSLGGGAPRTVAQIDGEIADIEGSIGDGFFQTRRKGKKYTDKLAEIERLKAEKLELQVRGIAYNPLASPTAKPAGSAWATAGGKSPKTSVAKRDPVADMLGDLSFDLDQTGRSPIEQAIFSNLRGKASIDSAAGKSIMAATLKLEFAKQKADELADAQDSLADAANDALVAFEGQADADIAGIYDWNRQALAAWSEEQRLANERFNYFADDVGFAVADAFDAMAWSGQSLGDTLKNLAMDFSQLVFRMAVLEPMARSVSAAIASIGQGGGGGFFGMIAKGIGSYFGASAGASDASSSGALASDIDDAISNLPARAGGGPVSAGQSYLVGELGPEVFRPSSSGFIIPHTSLGGGRGAPVFNIDARGSTDPVAVREQIEAALSQFGPQVVRDASNYTMGRLKRQPM